MAQQRRTAWEDTLINFTISSGGQDLETLTDAAKEHYAGYTVTRMIGHLWVLPSVPDGVDGVSQVDFGVAMLERDAVAAGAVPDPPPVSSSSV